MIDRDINLPKRPDSSKSDYVTRKHSNTYLFELTEIVFKSERYRMFKIFDHLT